jgi:hypothetical protein
VAPGQPEQARSIEWSSSAAARPIGERARRGAPAALGGVHGVLELLEHRREAGDRGAAGCGPGGSPGGVLGAALLVVAEPFQRATGAGGVAGGASSGVLGAERVGAERVSQLQRLIGCGLLGDRGPHVGVVLGPAAVDVVHRGLRQLPHRLVERGLGGGQLGGLVIGDRGLLDVGASGRAGRR